VSYCSTKHEMHYTQALIGSQLIVYCTQNKTKQRINGKLTSSPAVAICCWDSRSYCTGNYGGGEFEDSGSVKDWKLFLGGHFLFIVRTL